jgi:putative transcriptional regulator
LVATPQLEDPNFERTVILLLDCDVEGALGVILNRPSAVAVSAILPDWADAATDPAVLFQGGPVAMDSALGVAIRIGRSEDPPEGFRPVDGRFGIVDLDAEIDVLAPEVDALRVFAGYAGWGSVQLEAEIEEGSWFVIDAEPGDLAADDPADMWRRVLRRQRNELAWVALMPEDPSMN